jgi:hypothetical protein
LQHTMWSLPEQLPRARLQPTHLVAPMIKAGGCVRAG